MENYVYFFKKTRKSLKVASNIKLLINRDGYYL